MVWAQEVFMTDTGKSTWKEVIDEFGPGIVNPLRTYASSLEKNVKTADLKKKNLRPEVYKNWLKKITTKVFI